MYFLSALYTLQYVPIVKMTLVIFIQKKKKRKNEPYFGMGEKLPKLCHKTPLYIFSLGKGRESIRLQTLHKKLSKVRFLPCPQHANHSDSDTVWTMHAKIDQIQFTLPQLSHLSSNRRVCNLPLYLQFTTPARELTHRKNLSDPERHEFQKCHVSSLPEAREMPKILPRKTRILATPKFFATSSQGIAKTNRERHEFHTNFTQNCTH